LTNCGTAGDWGLTEGHVFKIY